MREAWAAAIELATQTYGGLTTLVNNAAANNASGLMAVTVEGWQTVLDVSLRLAGCSLRLTEGRLSLA